MILASAFQVERGVKGANLQTEWLSGLELELKHRHPIAGRGTASSSAIWANSVPRTPQPSSVSPQPQVWIATEQRLVRFVTRYDILGLS